MFHKTKEQVEADDALAKKEGFAKWMNAPATRMMISMIPAGEKREVLEILLQETFNSGYSVGGGQMLTSFVIQMMSGNKNNK